MTIRQKIAKPSDIPNQVFAIGDVTFRIPPSQIEIRKEDLTYRYRTLRSKVATKIPTGSGQISIHLAVPFLNEHLLSLHRLIVEIRNNPFVWVDNRFVRESIVPEWPYSQQMAFTITGLSVSNMPNATDGWILELDATWFNYFPFGHNYLFREDWTTNWLRSEVAGNKRLQSFTIGWKLNDEYQREYYSNPIEEIMNEGSKIVGSDVFGARVGQLTDTWSATQNKFLNTDHQRTIHEMEQNHPGIEFDLLPLPGNMRPANIVQQPVYSRIFVRYHNFLQRDALKKGWGIDVESDVTAYEKRTKTTGLMDSLFRTGKTVDGLPTVIPFDSLLIPRELRMSWISKMLNSNYGVRFNYHIFKEIRLPQKWNDNMQNKKNTVIQDLFGRLQGANNLSNILQGSKDGDYRSVPVLGAQFPITSPFGMRDDPVTGGRKMHGGIDFGAPRSTPIFAPEEGDIVVVQKNNQYKGNNISLKTAAGQWDFYHMDQILCVANTHVKAGDIIGTVGNTGKTTAVQPDGTRNETVGYHLHLVWKPGGGTAADPLPYLGDLATVQSGVDETAFDISPTVFDYTAMSTPTISTQDQLIEAARLEAKESLEISEEEALALQDLLAVLASEGWSYYDADTTVTNVWKKQLSLEIKNSGIDYATGRTDVPEEFKNNGIILTSVSASLSHIVAHIPILSHEYPTQQHLGSVEPEYQLEFAVLDGQSNLEGISDMAQMVQGMRSELHSNSRRFRPVLDGWCVATDTFVTRLFGTYQVNDFRVLEVNGQIADAKLKKRSIVSSSYEGTVPGNPGLSTISMNIQETNPYEQESLVNSSSGLQDKEESRRLVLQATAVLDLAVKYKDLLAPLFLAQKLGANLTDPTAADFGVFSIRNVNSIIALTPGNTQDTFLYSGDGETKLLMKSSTPQELQFLKSLGLEADYYGDSNQYIALDPAQLDSDYLGLVDYSATPFFKDSYAGQSQAQGLFESGRFDLPLAEGPSTALAAMYPSAVVYNIASLAEQNPVLAQMPIQKLMDYYIAINVYLQTGARMFAEVEEGGLDNAFVANALYGLPVKQDMWKTWELYLEEFVKVSYSSSANTALEELHSNPAWHRPGGKDWNNPLPESSRYEFADLARSGYGTYGAHTGWLYDMNTTLPTKVMTIVGAGFSQNVEFTDIYRTAQKDAINRLVGRYMLSFPLQTRLPDYVKQKYQFFIGNLIGNLTEGGRGKTPALDYMSDYLIKNAESSGNITWDFVSFFNSQNPIWQSKDVKDGERAVRSGYLGGAVAMDPLSFLPGRQAIADANIQRTLGGLEAIGFTGATDYFYQAQNIGNELGSPFVYPVEQSFEQEKVKYIKGLLSVLADDILGDYRMLQMLGLEHLMFIDENRDFTGMQCYPDLDLPAHPYYGNTKQVHPDFYMWNIYEDGGALAPDQLQAIQTQVNFVVANCHESMKRMSAPGGYDERTDMQTPELSVDDPIVLATQITPEGQEGMETPFAPSSAAKAAVEVWNKAIVGENTSSPFIPQPLSKTGTITIVPPRASAYATGKDAARLTSLKPSDYLLVPRLSNTEGHGGVGGDLQYPLRTDRAHYDYLIDQFNKTTHMFGSSEGYTNQEINLKNAPEVYAANKLTNIERVPETAHNFDLATLQQLSKDSAKDLISQKMSMKRAFPTFKLYFIEEDEFETRFMNFDDFYSYNAVKEMTVVQSRKIAADHAIVTLQNISGTLDGTRRNSISDLDYFADEGTSSSAKKKLAAHDDTDSSLINSDPVTNGTSAEQPFGSVVLRPGLNVQLRIGYCVDDQTEILTKRGWLKHHEVLDTDETLTLNHQTGVSEWQPILKMNRFDVVDEEMVSIEGIKHSSLTTLGHRWPVVRKHNWSSKTHKQLVAEWATSEELKRSHVLIGAAANKDLPIQKTWSDDFVQAMAWFWTEGCINNTATGRTPTIVISQSVIANPYNVQVITECLTRLFGPSCELSKGSRWYKDTTPKWRLNKRMTRDEVEFRLNGAASRHLLTVAPDKIVSLDWIRELTLDQLELFIRYSNKGDGHYSQSDTGPLLISQKVPKALDALELAAILAGYRTRNYQSNTVAKDRYGNEYHPQMLYISRASYINLSDGIEPKKVKYTGTTWCPTTRNSSWMARRNGYIYFTGNSNDPNCLHVMLSGRIVDVTWNTTGDLAEIMIQSFGAELEQVIKGTSRDSNSLTYATTHELLGSMMLEPEVVHFGRWEFGQLFQTGEAKDFRLDFTEYSREGSMGRFGITSWIQQWIMNHPYLTLGLGIGATFANFLPYGRIFGFLGKASKFTGLGGAAAFEGRAATGALGTGGYVAILEGLDEAGQLAYLASAEARIAAQGVKVAAGLSKEGAVEFSKVLAAKTASAVEDFGKAVDAASRGEALGKLEGYIQTTQFKGKWFAKPWVELTGASFANAAGAVGFTPVGTFLNLAIGLNLKAAGAVFLTAAAVDAIIDNWLRPFYSRTIGTAQKFFSRTNASMFMTPQDDNLYPPHPKDYMSLDSTALKALFEAGLRSASMALTSSDEAAITAFEFLFPDRILTKKVNPDDCKYQLVNTSIWGVFHEMSLRHPGWVYGARPYGNAYRYTMFFGLPAQRYWARPATNGFITRANDLYKYLTNAPDDGLDGMLITEFEFKALYGDGPYNDLLNNARIQQEVVPASNTEVNFMTDTLDQTAVSLTPENAIRAEMTATVLAEYLRAVQIRFEPFRRYHLFSSERDIVWNGIMGSENAVTNAVDVTYFPSGGSRTDPEESEIRTAVFKAHSFIPESKLRVAPVRWQNCLGYGMAQRYAMGELCERMRDMYRGELIILGNPRVRPWDIGILADSYNSMVGPIEVEQVVHTYSHETGYITEIKPSAVVFANEISGWPMLEAMKTFALAIQDIHSRYAGVKADNGSTANDPGSLATAASIMAALPGLGGLTGDSRQYDSFIDEKYRKLFGEEGANLTDLWHGEPPPNLDSIDGIASDILQNAIIGSTIAGFAGTLVGGVGVLSTVNSAAGGSAKEIFKAFAKRPTGLAYGAGLIAGLGFSTFAFGAPLALSQIDFPGLAFLMGGSTLFLQCLRNDALILVPLTKSGTPIVAGLAFNDPAMLWSSFRGRINRYFSETLQGTGNMLDLYKRYGTEIWTKLNDQDLGTTAGAAWASEKSLGTFDPIRTGTNPPIMPNFGR